MESEPNCSTNNSNNSNSSNSNNSNSSNSSFKENTESRIIVDGKFFKLVSNKCTNSVTVATCVKCEPQIIEIRGSASSSSNFLSHLKRKHGIIALNEYSKYIRDRKIERRISTNNNCTNRTSIRMAKLTLTQAKFEQNIINYIIHAMIPLQAVDNPYFSIIFEDLNIAHYGLQLISRRTLGRRIDDLYISNKEKLKEILREVQYICTTVDIWSGKTRSFLGVTAHWIDSACNRKSAALACRRFHNTHSAENITHLLANIHTVYNIDSTQIIGTVTDNGSNFVKAFKEYGIKNNFIEIAHENHVNINTPSEIQNCTDSSDEDDGKDYDNSSSEICKKTPKKIKLPFLPKHLRCCAHILHRIASADVIKTINDTEHLLQIHQKVIYKCNILWKAMARPKSAEIIQSLLGFSLPRPGITRWNSLYDALRKILEIKSKSTLLFQALNIRCMISDDEFKYIDEHLQCTKPIADALDVLQGEKYAYYGIVLPTLISLRCKLENLDTCEFEYCKPVANSLLANVNRRFMHFYHFVSEESLNAAIATLAHPEFKNKWISFISQEYHQKILNAFKDCVSAEMPRILTNENDNPPNTGNNFFDIFKDASMNSNSTSEAEAQIANFFNDQRNTFQIFHNYESIRAVFIKYNTPLPSSAPVERLFSYATMTNGPKSNRLSDEKFEQRILLRYNLHLLS